jgi:hypothetical protein
MKLSEMLGNFEGAVTFRRKRLTPTIFPKLLSSCSRVIPRQPLLDVPRQALLPDPVASLKNVTEISAPGTTFNQRQFRQWMFVPCSFAGYG